jgi:sugar/nucleoside kinase (ribokinase family)
MSILVVGSVAYDTVETPFGKAERVLGGSASFFAVAASFFVPVNLVGVVGDDFGEEQLKAFRGRDIDLEGLERVAGKTFHWAGKYSYDLNARETIFTHLNVFEASSPRSRRATAAPSTSSWATSIPCSSATCWTRWSGRSAWPATP